jgi:hypothetical protein
MKIRSTIAVVVAAGTLAAVPSAVPARPVSGPIAIAAKTCSAGYKHAYINGAQKCLRRGEFCAHRYDHRAPKHWPYIHYGFRCIKYYPNVDRYRLTYA